MSYRITDVSFEVGDHYSYWIQPGFSITDGSAVYLKLGRSEADTKVTGDVTSPADLEGDTFAIGTKSQLGTNFYIKTEAGFTEYDQLSVTGKGTANGISSGTTVTADPTIAFGTVSLGFRF